MRRSRASPSRVGGVARDEPFVALAGVARPTGAPRPPRRTRSSRPPTTTWRPTTRPARRVCRRRRARAAPASARRRRRRRVLRDLGTMQFRNGDIGAAKKTWADALRLAARHRAQPRLRHARPARRVGRGEGRAAEQPVARWEHSRRATSRTRPQASRRSTRRCPSTWNTRARHGVARVVVKYKGAAASDWARVELKRMGSGWGGAHSRAATSPRARCATGSRASTTAAIRSRSSGRPEAPVHRPHPGRHRGRAAAPARQEPAARRAARTAECPPGLARVRPGGGGKAGRRAGKPRRPRRRLPGPTLALLGRHLGRCAEFLSLPGGNDVCQLTPATPLPANSSNYYCTNPDGSDFPLAQRPRQQNSQHERRDRRATSTAGCSPATFASWRSFDYALSTAFLARGAPRLRPQLLPRSGGGDDGKAFGRSSTSRPRATYLFGARSARPHGLRPDGLRRGWGSPSSTGTRRPSSR